jgi:hypothetical protein
MRNPNAEIATKRTGKTERAERVTISIIKNVLTRAHASRLIGSTSSQEKAGAYGSELLFLLVRRFAEAPNGLNI